MLQQHSDEMHVMETKEEGEDSTSHSHQTSTIFNELNEKIVHNLRLKCSEQYNSHNVCNHWYNMIKNLPSVVEEN